jgi:hypothetical protein
MMMEFLCELEKADDVYVFFVRNVGGCTRQIAAGPRPSHFWTRLQMSFFTSGVMLDLFDSPVLVFMRILSLLAGWMAHSNCV